MANEGEPGPVGSAGGEGRAPLPLEERVARLEFDLATLRRQIAQGMTQPAPAPGAVVEVRAAQPPPPPPIPAPTPAGAAVAEEGRARRLFSESWAAAVPRSQAANVAGPRESLESRLGSQIFNRIAIVMLLTGTAYFLKLAVDRGWIVPSPTGRLIAGLVAGSAVVLWSERFRRKGFAAFSYSLKALGSGVLYLSLWAAFQLYHLLPAGAALGLMVLVTAWNGYMAWAQDSELLAAYALAGGFGTPLLLSTGGNHEVFLFTYLLAIDVATVALVRLRPWPRLLLGAFPLTVAYFAAWFVASFEASELTPTALFIALFAGVFASVPLRREPPGAASPEERFLPVATALEDVLLPLANAALAALAFYSALEDSGHHALLPWLMLVLAAAYLGIMRAPQTRAAVAIHLSLVVVFLTIAIPLKASGHWITVSWLVEGLALLWVAARLAPSGAAADAAGGVAGGPAGDPASAHASRVLRPLALASLVLGFCGICERSILLNGVGEVPLLNRGAGTALVGIAVFGAAAWLALHAAARARAGAAEGPALGWGTIAIGGFVLIDLTALLLTMRELLNSQDWNGIHPPFQTADFATALMGLAVFAGVVAVSLRVARTHPGEGFWMSCAALTTIAFNLVALLTGVREIEAIWERSSEAATLDAGLQQALAVSGFLMVYGAALLAAGFWRRSGFLRWQALGLLVFSIFKTFLYDMRNLSQGYRVVSFLGLGALLMAISFAYQKDWLGLREAEAAPGAEEGAAAGGDAGGEGGPGAGAGAGAGVAR